MVDHINRDQTDNAVENLRWVTARANNANRHPPEGASLVR